MDRSMKTLSFQVEDGVVDQVDALAERMGSDRQSLLRQAVERYLRDAEAWEAGVDEALKDIAEGRTYPSAAVHAWIEAWGTQDDREYPRQTR